MEQSETFDKVTRLGKLLVKELSLENSSDTLGRWMAHYVAGKMDEASNGTGKRKEEAEQACTETILALWDHRWKMSSRLRPLKSFREILETLSAMVPENKQSYYFHYQDVDPTPSDNQKLKKAREIDAAARGVLKYLMSEAAKEVASPDLHDWIEASDAIAEYPDMMVIRTVYERKEYAVDRNVPLFDDNELTPGYLLSGLEQTLRQMDLLIQHTKLIKTEITKKIKATKAAKSRSTE
ncbi:hypothetical protein DBR43_31715 [Pedobacter sp. KBW06]|uniref:hypothetical protein n=1 Tax=Pedobacter sp. KBW06 TaxID=2153359 RepID=UPI000F59161B|nr:hypothetical protein [Pedobacter sp. KBW06]RQO64849.1 hypothetical protein DBR43_31715 [Pedobacter sp. KBW06]